MKPEVGVPGSDTGLQMANAGGLRYRDRLQEI